MIIKTEEQLEKMKEIGFICATIRDEMKKKAVPGVSTKELDNIEDMIDLETLLQKGKEDE